MNNRLPQELLLEVFSFFTKPKDFWIFEEVCKDWNKAINKSQLWINAIKPTFKHLCIDENANNNNNNNVVQYSNLKAKEIYRTNIDARIDTFYVVGTKLITHKIDYYDRYAMPVVERHQPSLGDIEKTFPQNQAIVAFYDRKQAIAYADEQSNHPDNYTVETAPDPDFIYIYQTVFAVRLKEFKLSPLLLTPTNENSNSNVEFNTSDLANTYETTLSNIEYIYDAYYKSGRFLRAEGPYKDQIRFKEYIMHINKSLDKLQQSLDTTNSPNNRSSQEITTNKTCRIM